jgi:hypothetical protein
MRIINLRALPRIPVAWVLMNPDWTDEAREWLGQPYISDAAVAEMYVEEVARR